MRTALTVFLLSLVALPALGQESPRAEEVPAPVEEAPITAFPSVKTFVDAIYPPAALQAQISASVALEIDIGADGSVEGVTIVSSSTVALTQTSSAGPRLTAAEYGFTSSATTAAAQLVFNPAMAGETPVPVRIGYTFDFEPPPLPPAPELVTTSSATKAAKAPGIANYSGTIREKGTRTLLPGVVVTVFQQTDDDVIAFEATTDKDGKFEFYDLAPGIWKVQSNLRGYFPIRDAQRIVVQDIIEVTYYIERGAYNPYEVHVVGTKAIKEVTRRTLTRNEITKVPGTLGDPVAVVQNLPGVARAPGGLLLVRGSGPQDTGILVDGVFVPLIYHFGGLKSVIPAELVDSVDFYPGNYSTYYGRFTGGILDLHTRKLDPDQLHGSADLSIIDSSLFVQAPITDTLSIAAGGRTSYFGPIIKAAVPEDADVSITAAPKYSDYQLFANWRPNPGHEVRAMFFGSADSFETLFEKPAEFDAQIQADGFELKTGFQRGIIDYRYQISPKVKNSLQLALGADQFNFSFGQQFFGNFDILLMQGRENFNWQATEWLEITLGMDVLVGRTDGEIQAPKARLEGEVAFNDDLREVTYTKVDGVVSTNLAPYVEATIKLMDEQLTLVPGFRMDWWSRVAEVTFDPRLIAHYQLNEQWAVKGGVGLTHQQPQPDQLDPNFGNPDLGLIEAIQYSVGGEWLPTEHFKFNTTFFLKSLRHLVARSTGLNDGTALSNQGSGTVIGLEVFAERKFYNNFRGWLSYTLSRAVRRDLDDGPSRLFDFDQTHILTLVGSYQLPRGWEIGLRWRLVSGNPNTPFVDYVVLVDADRPTGIAGAINSGRNPLFHQLDLRVDKTWIFDWWTLSAYLSLLNTYNQTNTEGQQYEFDFSKSEPIPGLPILPILGIKGEF